MSIYLSQKAKFYDGKTGNPHTVSLTLTNNSILLESDKTLIETWDIHDLVVISHPELPVPGIYGHAQEKEARLYIDSAKEWKAIYARLQKSSKRKIVFPTSWLSFVLYAAMSITSLCFLFLLFPKIIENTAYFIPYKVERSIGHQAVTSMTKGKKSCVSPEGRAALLNVFERLKTKTSRKIDYEIRVVEDDFMPNAFAAPGGYIVVFSNVIDRAKTPEEVIGVLAHEIAHVELYHTTKGIVRTIGMQFVLSMITGGNSIDSLAGFFSQMSYSRDDESAADMRGRDIMVQANIDPKGIRHFFESVRSWEENLFSDTKEENRKTVKDGKEEKNDALSKFMENPLWEIFSAHPDTDKRINSLKKLEKNAKYPPALSKHQWQSLKDICNVKK